MFILFYCNLVLNFFAVILATSSSQSSMDSTLATDMVQSLSTTIYDNLNTTTPETTLPSSYLTTNASKIHQSTTTNSFESESSLILNVMFMADFRSNLIDMLTIFLGIGIFGVVAFLGLWKAEIKLAILPSLRECWCVQAWKNRKGKDDDGKTVIVENKEYEMLMMKEKNRNNENNEVGGLTVAANGNGNSTGNLNSPSMRDIVDLSVITNSFDKMREDINDIKIDVDRSVK